MESFILLLFLVLSTFGLLYVGRQMGKMSKNLDLKSLREIEFGCYLLVISTILNLFARFASLDTNFSPLLVNQVILVFDYLGTFLIFRKVIVDLLNLKKWFVAMVSMYFGALLVACFLDGSFSVVYNEKHDVWAINNMSLLFGILNSVPFLLLLFVLSLIAFSNWKKSFSGRNRIKYLFLGSIFFLFLAYFHALSIHLTLGLIAFRFFYILSIVFLFIAIKLDPHGFSLVRGNVIEILVARNDQGNVPIAQFEVNPGKIPVQIKTAVYFSIAATLSSLLNSKSKVNLDNGLKVITFKDKKLYVHTRKKITGYLLFTGELERYASGFKAFMEWVYENHVQDSSVKETQMLSQEKMREKVASFFKM